MEDIRLTAMAILVIGFSLQVHGIAGRTFVFGCSNYTFHMASKSILSWMESRRLCNKTGSDLVSIETLEEWQFLKSTIQLMQTSEYFIGLKKQSENWKWVCNYGKEIASKGYLNWGTREPSGNGECTKMWGKDHLSYDDVSCDRAFSGVGYVCERAANCNDEKEIIYNGACNGESTTEPVTSPTKASSKLQSTNAATVKTPSVKSAMHSTSSIKRKNSKATQPENIIDDSSVSKATKSNSYLILVISLLLAVILLVILTAFWLLFVRRRRSQKLKVNTLFCCATKSASSLRQQTTDHEHHLESSADPTMQLNMLQPEESLDTYETVNEASQEHTYAVVEKSSGKSKRGQRESSTEEQGVAMQTLSAERYLIPTEHPVTKNAAEEQEGCEDKFKKKEETKDCVYAVVHIKPGQIKASVREGAAVQGENLEATFTPCLSSKDGNSVELLDVSSCGHEKEMTSHEGAAGYNPDGEEECKDHLYAVVNKANKKRTPPQKPAPYCGIVYTDLSHSTDVNTGRINRASLPTVYADIDYLKTDAAKSRLPEENVDQTTEHDEL